MLKRFAATLGFLLTLGSTDAQALTAEQARDLPEQELAKQVLGDAGKLFVEVRRPNWQDGAFLIARPEVKGKAPPLRSLTFYERPDAFISPAGVEGMCLAERLIAAFGPDGHVARLIFDEVAGFSQPVTFGRAMPDAAHLNELRQRCAHLSAAQFFGLPRDAPGDIGAAIDAVNQVHETIMHGGAPWLTLTCPMSDSCKAAGYAAGINIDHITGLSRCHPPEKSDDPSHPKDQCWIVGLGGARCITEEELIIVINGDVDHLEIRSAEFRENRIVC